MSVTTDASSTEVRMPMAALALLVVAVPVLAGVGVVLGCWVAAVARRGSSALTTEQHEVLRRRRSALEAEAPARSVELREQLQDAGIAVRDRDGHQDARRLAPPVVTTRPGGGRGQAG